MSLSGRGVGRKNILRRVETIVDLTSNPLNKLHINEGEERDSHLTWKDWVNYNQNRYTEPNRVLYNIPGFYTKV